MAVEEQASQPGRADQDISEEPPARNMSKVTPSPGPDAAPTPQQVRLLEDVTALESLRFKRADSVANVSTEIDWTSCELVERIPGKVSGRPIMRGTRIMPEGIVNSYDHGETIEGWPSLSVAQIQRLIEFAHTQRGQPTP